ncbi:MAG: hypothetical protein Q8N63_07050 [Nanoarchaeota archaeon]|nr:hypothetical protein [Nanoarchaeota archaeon]
MIQTKQTLIQRLGTGIVLAAAGLGGLVTGGCVGDFEHRDSQGCWKSLNANLYYSQNCNENWQYVGASGDYEIDGNGNMRKVDLTEPLRLITGGLLGVASSGALDSANRTAQQNLAVRGAAAGAQQYQTNDAIRNAGQGNANVNNNGEVTLDKVKSWNRKEKEEFLNQHIKKCGLEEAFFCEYFVEKEDWSTAYKNIKNVFKDNDRIRAVSLWKVIDGDINGKKVTLDILGIDTNKIAYNCGEIKIDPDNVIRTSDYNMWSTHYDIYANEIKENVGGSRFRAIWNLNGEPKKYADLTIIDTLKKELKVVEHNSNQ